jgi:hypothetical protein
VLIPRKLRGKLFEEKVDKYRGTVDIFVLDKGKQKLEIKFEYPELFKTLRKLQRFRSWRYFNFSDQF